MGKPPRIILSIHIKSLLMKNGKTKEETDAILEKIREEEDLQVVTQRLS